MKSAGYLSLDGDWELVERPLAHGVSSYNSAATAKASFAARVPGDVNDDICRSGKLPEPLVALNFRQYSNWVPERSWWYRRKFEVAKSAEPFAELSLDGLDVHADVWLNGKHLGHHATAFCPFVADVSDIVKRGKQNPNLLVVRLTTGREHVADITPGQWPLLGAVSTEASRGYPDRGFPQRVFLRKPAYTWGWDWSPALPTCGITGNCGLRFFGMNRIEHVGMETLDLRRYRCAVIRAKVDLRRKSVTSTTWGKVTLRMTCEDGCVDVVSAGDVLIRSGLTRIELRMDIKKPRPWWPNGAGDQHRYKVEVTLECDGEKIEYPAFRWGMKTVVMDVRPGVFRFVINGRAMFIQGANWIPCDHLYGRTTPARLAQLVREAAEAHFNCLRVWGGGRYELDAFFDACDEKGILLWHDFMSACAPLPYENPGFAELFQREALFQMRRLQNHACMMLWCGNNEVGACYEWAAKEFGRRDPAWPLYFEDLPRLVARESTLPYWPTSPYGGAKSVHDPRVGDDHHWVVMKPDPELWSTPEYWDSKAIPIFNSEYGYGGPCCLDSTRDYLGTEKPSLSNAVAREHTNTFYDIPRVLHGIKQHYNVDKPESISDYIRLGGLCQGLNYGYSLESMRAHAHNWGGIFWMYNDAWGENGWTIVDYYLRRKISYYFVKRALKPLTFILRRGGRKTFGGPNERVVLIVINATPRVKRGKIFVGYRRYDSAKEWKSEPFYYRVDGFSRQVLDVGPVPSSAKLRHGTIVAVESMFPFTSTVFRHAPYHQLNLPPAKISTVFKRVEGKDLLIRVKADRFAHAVRFDIPDDFRMSDCWFDLAPNEARTVRIYNGAKLPQPVRVLCENS